MLVQVLVFVVEVHLELFFAQLVVLVLQLNLQHLFVPPIFLNLYA